MNREELNAALEQLHAELRRLPSVDAAERARLRELEQDIRTLLSREPEEQPQHYKRLSERLRENVELLEAAYPRTTMVMGQVIDALAKMGI